MPTALLTRQETSGEDPSESPGLTSRRLAGDGKYLMASGFHTGLTSLVFGRLVGSSAYAGVHLAALREDAAAGRLGCHALSLAGSAMRNVRAANKSTRLIKIHIP